MARTIVGLFDSFPEAQEVVQDLVNADIASENISIIANDAEGWLVGSLTQAGIPEKQAQSYAEGVRRGGTLVMVNTMDDVSDRASEVMNRHHVVDVAQRSQQWNGFNEHGEAFAFDDSRQTDEE